MGNLNPEAAASFMNRLQQITISADRQRFLTDAARRCVEENQSGTYHLLCVCTHNSRRSQFSQFWAGYFAQKNGLQQIVAHSCGTEATECNPRTLQALSRAGIAVATDNAESNPKSTCGFDGYETVLYSKAFGEASLPTDSIVALMCCDDADQKCPTVAGAVSRIPLHYRDPKYADGTSEEEMAYDEANTSIAAEMQFFVQQLALAIES